MRRPKLTAVLTSLCVATAGTTALVAGPAHADDTPIPTTVQLSFTDPSDGTQYGAWSALYGDPVGPLTGAVSDGTAPPPVGTATLEQRLPGGDWTATTQVDDDVSDGVTFTTPKARSNVRYRVQYAGGTDDATLTTWSPSTSNSVRVLAYWKFKPTKARYRHGLVFTWWGALAPRVDHHKVLIQVKNGSSWKKYKVVRTNAKSRWKVRVKAGHNRWVRYRAVVTRTKTLHKNGTAAKFKVRFNRTADDHPSPRALIRR